MTIDADANIWSYDFDVDEVWQGDADSHSIGLLPLSIYMSCPACPFCDSSTQAATRGAGVQVGLQGQGHLLITDSLGRRIGFTGTEMQFVNEIPGGVVMLIAGGLGIEMEPLYTVPAGAGYECVWMVTLSGTHASTIRQFGAAMPWRWKIFSRRT